MIKGLLWAFSLEMHSFVNALISRPDIVKFFAYGQEMSPKFLRERGIKILGQSDFILKDYCDVYNHPLKGSSKSSLPNIIYRKESVAYGRLISISVSDADRLDHYMLARVFNERQRVYTSCDGEIFFFYQSRIPLSSETMVDRRVISTIKELLNENILVPESHLKLLMSKSGQNDQKKLASLSRYFESWIFRKMVFFFLFLVPPFLLSVPIAVSMQYPVYVFGFFFVAIFLLLYQLRNYRKHINLTDSKYNELKQENDLLVSTVESVQDGIVITDVNHQILYVNAAFERLSGYQRRSLIGLPHKDVLKKDLRRDEHFKHIEEKLRLNEKHIGKFTGISKTRTEFHVSFTALPIVNENGQLNYILYIEQDLTEEAKLEKMRRDQIEVINYSRMAALSEMARVVSHEVNNPLTIIEMSSGVLAMKLEKDAASSELVHKIGKAAKRIFDVTKTLAEISSSDVSTEHSHKLSAIINQARALIQYQLDLFRISVTVSELDPNIEIPCSKQQMIMIFLNLLINSFNRTKELEKDRRITLRFKITPDYLTFSIEDTGRVIAPEQREHVFDPGGGELSDNVSKGLGLYVVKGFVEAHRGRIYLHENERPTTFVVVIPLKRAKT